MKYILKFKNDNELMETLEILDKKGYIYHWAEGPTLGTHYLAIDEERKLYWYESIRDADYWLKRNPIYEPGDLFQIKPNLSEYLGVTSKMLDMAGKLVTLKKVTHTDFLVFEENGVEVLFLKSHVNRIKKAARVAKRDEFVLVTNNCAYNVEYEDGDILKIIGANDEIAYYKDENGKFLCNFEYLVLEGYEECDYVKKFFDESLYTGKVVCIDDACCACYTTGKIYQIKDGMIKIDDGTWKGPIYSFEDFLLNSSAAWLEIKEED